MLSSAETPQVSAYLSRSAAKASTALALKALCDPPYRYEYGLIEAAQHGDLAAFNELILSCQDLVYRQAWWLLKEEEAAEDATQETFLKVYRKINTFQLGKPFRSWLLKITTNHCLDKIRSARRHPEQTLEPVDRDGEAIEPAWLKDPGDTPEQALIRAEEERRIIYAIQSLSPEYRAVVIMVDLQELDYTEVSAILNVPLGTMKSRLSRARRQLRLALQ